MPMIHIELPDSLGEFVCQEVVRLGLKSADEYFQNLVSDAERKEKELEELEAFVQKGIDSAEKDELTPYTSGIWEQLIKDVQRRSRRKEAGSL